MAKARRGRPSKGPRVEMTIRVRPEVHDAATAVSKMRGVSLTDFVAGLLERELGAAVEMAQANRMSEVA
jgi:predicted HicB family RNase H-like nuclease